MSIYPWIEKIDFQKFAMPLVVKRDNEYYPGIVEKLADLVFELERCGASDKIVLAVKEYRKKIISSIIQLMEVLLQMLQEFFFLMALSGERLAILIQAGLLLEVLKYVLMI